MSSNDKLIVAKARYYLSAEDRKSLSQDISEMIKSGAVVIGDEVDSLLMIDMETGTFIPIKSNSTPPDEKKN